MSDQSVADDPFDVLKRYKEFLAVVEPLAAEFRAERQPLEDALVALANGLSADHLMAAGARLKDAGLADLPAERANTTLGVTPEPRIIALQTAWRLLAAATSGNRAGVEALLSTVRSYPEVTAALPPQFFPTIAETCLGAWRCVASPRFVDQLRAHLDRLQLTAVEVRAWMYSNDAGLSDGASGALPPWLWSIHTGRPITLTDPVDTWGPDAPGLSFRQYLYRGPIKQERFELMYEKGGQQIRAGMRAVQRLLDAPPLPPIGLPQSNDRQPKTKGKNIDARMLKTMAGNLESHGWSASQWAGHLQCADSTVKESKTWKGPLKAVRAMQAVDSASKMDTTKVRRRAGRKRA